MNAAPSLANPRRRALACVLALVMLAAAGCQSVWEPGVPVRLLDAAAQAQHEWPVSSPAVQGMDEQRLALLRVQLAQHAPAIRSVLIARHGQLVFEHYGAGFGYDSQASHLLSVMLARTTGMRTAAFAEQHLFGPLGVPHYRWDTDGRGHALGGAGLYLRPRDVAKLGQLFLDQGVWRGRQLVSRDYVAQATTPQTSGGWPLGVGYGYHWWTAPIQGLPAFSASGYGGQWIRVIPALDMVVVITVDDAAATLTRWILHEYAIPAAR